MGQLSKIIGVYAGSKCAESERINEFSRAAGGVLGQYAQEIIIGGVDVGIMQIVGEAAAQSQNEDGEYPPIHAYVAKQWADGIQPSRYSNVTQDVVEDDRARDEEFARADTFVAFPGSVGTMREIFETANSIVYLGRDARLIIFNADGYYSGLRDVLGNAHTQGFNNNRVQGRVIFVDTSDALEEALTLDK